ncbi:hypothetical protein ONZ51_g4455 [Trametes cubensis]|uniref:Velvet domain-containing protein n=1 Tax=Trametes cubensis TaxID=1111947 RepID=A0AAD7XEM0_9APHY|nr:hypothetical protein ONZ51_g4455 [Trametes cubensis]
MEDDIVAWFGYYPIFESSNCTRALTGATYTTAVVIDHQSKQTAMFVFTDLAVQVEGTFVLRYRVFHILPDCATPPPKPILAACYGGSFKVYSAKAFPGLLASTALTKRLAPFLGIRVSVRDTPRKRRKPHEIMREREAKGGSNAESAELDPPGSNTATRRLYLPISDSTAQAIRHILKNA